MKKLSSHTFQLIKEIVTVMVTMTFYYTFLNKNFKKSQNWTFLKMSKNRNSKKLLSKFIIFIVFIVS